MPSECCRCTAPIGRVPMDALLRFAPLLSEQCSGTRCECA
jgi:hypothetical protein